MKTSRGLRSLASLSLLIGACSTDAPELSSPPHLDDALARTLSTTPELERDASVWNAVVSGDELTRANAPLGLGAPVGTTSLPAGRYEHRVFAYNGFLYSVGGRNDVGSATAEVWYAPIGSGGALGGWQATTPLPSPRAAFGLTTYAGHVYVAGGGLEEDTVYRARLNADGTVGAWSATTPLPNGRIAPGLVAHRGFIYQVSGSSADEVNVAPIRADGGLGAWSPTTPTRAGDHFSVFAYDGFIYRMHGWFAGGLGFARVNADGSLGAWHEMSSSNWSSHASVATSGGLHIVHGVSSFSSMVMPMRANHAFDGGWLFRTALDTPNRYALAAASYGGWLYVVGGWDQTTTSALTDVRAAPFAPTSVLGDLVTDTLSTGPRTNHGSAVIDDLLYLFGGETSAGAVATTAYCQVTSTFSQTCGLTAPLPTARTNLAGASYEGFVYAVGGSGPAITSGEVLVGQKVGAAWTISSWTPTTPFDSVAVESPCAFVHRGALYVVGGDDGSTGTLVRRGVLASDGTVPAWTLLGPLPAFRAQHGCVVHDERLYVVGGHDGNDAVTSVLMSPIAADGTLGAFVPLTALPEARARHGTLAYGGYLMVLGGNDGSAPQATTWAAPLLADGTLGSWTAGASSFQGAREGHSTDVFGGRVILVGGDMGAGPVDSLASGHLALAGTPAQTANVGAFADTRYQLAAAAHGNVVYALGGFEGAAMTAKVDRWTLDVADGTTAGRVASTALPAPRADLAAFTRGGRLYALGGQQASGPTSAIDVASIAADGSLGSWAANPTPLPAAVAGHAVATFGDTVYVVGGSDGATRLSTIYRARIAADGSVGAWTADTSLPEALVNHAAAAHAGWLYVLGGERAAGQTSAVWAAPIAADGDLGAFRAAAALPRALAEHAVVALPGYLLVVGGKRSDGGASGTWYLAAINAGGGLSAFTSAGSTLLVRREHAVAVADGWLTILGGQGVQTVSTALLRHPIQRGLYVKRIDLGATATQLGSLIVRGDAARGGKVNAAYRVAPDGATPSFGAWVDKGEVALGGLTPLLDLGVRYVEVELTLDDSASYVVNPDAAARDIDDVEITWDLCEGVTCAALDTCHVAGVCDPATGVCSNPAIDDDTPCTDGVYCNGAETCQAGVCTGSSGDPCAGNVGDADDDCSESCDEATDTCTATDPASSPCDDGLYCTTTDTCAGDSCTGAGDPCAASLADGDANCSEACDEAADSCSAPEENGAPCSDGAFCNGTESCQSGSCGQSTGDPCAALMADGDANCSEACNETADACTAAETNGAPCSDGDYCNGTESCQGGSCGQSTGDPCAANVGDADGDCSESCDEITDDCTANDPNGASCTDDRWCTVTDTCSAGECVGSGDPCASSVGDADTDCTESCNETTDDCTAADPGGSPCDDGLFCTGADACSGGACVPAGDPCAALLGNANADCSESCNELTNDCTAVDADGSACDDDVFCNGAETCRSGVCGASSGDPCALNAGDSDTDCTESCNEVTDNCTAPDPNGAACSDGVYCNGVESCAGGVCGASSGDPCAPRIGDDDADCSEACDETSRTCTSVEPNGSPCSDGLFCTTGESCTSGVCGGGAPRDCSSLSGDCGLATCNEGAGACQVQPANQGGACDDGDACTSGETCDAGLCGAPTATVTCTALDQCHAPGTCDPATGQCSNPPRPDGTACEADGDRCTLDEACSAGVCGASTRSVVCAPIDDCHGPGTCDPTSGRCSTPPLPDGTSCDDGNACTSSETCSAGACTPAVTRQCEAPNACHQAFCNRVTGACEVSPMLDTVPCPGGVCRAGECVADEGGGGGAASEGGCSCRANSADGAGLWLSLGLLLRGVTMRRRRAALRSRTQL